MQGTYKFSRRLSSKHDPRPRPQYPTQTWKSLEKKFCACYSDSQQPPLYSSISTLPCMLAKTNKHKRSRRPEAFPVPEKMWLCPKKGKKKQKDKEEKKVQQLCTRRIDMNKSWLQIKRSTHMQNRSPWSVPTKIFDPLNKAYNRNAAKGTPCIARQYNEIRRNTP